MSTPVDRDRAFDDLFEDQDEVETDEWEDEGVEAAEADDEPKRFYFGKSAASIAVREDHTPRDREHVPEWDDEYEPDEALLEKLAICISLDQPVLLVGPRGCGKTSAVRALAAATRQPLRRINMTNQTRTRDFVGYRTLDYEEDEDGEVRQLISFVDGIFPDAIRHDDWMLIDELDAAPPGVTLAMQAVLEDARTLILAENGGEIVKPPGARPGTRDDDGNLVPESQHRRFRIFATANTLGYGDDTGFYAGTNVMNMATLDRFAVIKVDYPEPEHEAKIVKSRSGLTDTACKHLVDFARAIRKAVSDDNCGVTVSTRQLEQWARMIKQVHNAPVFLWPPAGGENERHAIRLAYSMTIGGKLPEDDADFYAGVFHREHGWSVVEATS
jgi:cobaltochelatase CobS